MYLSVGMIIVVIIFSFYCSAEAKLNAFCNSMLARIVVLNFVFHLSLHRFAVATAMRVANANCEDSK
jgi:hypothetical protein